MFISFTHAGLEDATVLGWLHYDPDKLTALREHDGYDVAHEARSTELRKLYAYLAGLTSEFVIRPLEVITAGDIAIGTVKAWSVVVGRPHAGSTEADLEHTYEELQKISRGTMVSAAMEVQRRLNKADDDSEDLDSMDGPGDTSDAVIELVMATEDSMPVSYPKPTQQYLSVYLETSVEEVLDSYEGDDAYPVRVRSVTEGERPLNEPGIFAHRPKSI